MCVLYGKPDRSGGDRICELKDESTSQVHNKQIVTSTAAAASVIMDPLSFGIAHHPPSLHKRRHCRCKLSISLVLG